MELPHDVLLRVVRHIDETETLEVARRVCASWSRAVGESQWKAKWKAMRDNCRDVERKWGKSALGPPGADEDRKPIRDKAARDDVLAMVECAHDALARQKWEFAGHAALLAGVFFDRCLRCARPDDELRLLGVAALSVAVKSASAEHACEVAARAHDVRADVDVDADTSDDGDGSQNDDPLPALLASVPIACSARRADVSRVELRVLDALEWQTRAVTPSMLARNVVLPELLNAVASTKAHGEAHGEAAPRVCCASSLADALLVRSMRHAATGLTAHTRELASAASSEAVEALAGQGAVIEATADALFAAHGGDPCSARALRETCLGPALRALAPCARCTEHAACTCARIGAACVAPWACPTCARVAYLHTARIAA